MAGASYDFGTGFTAAVGYAGPEGGIMTEESMDAYGINAAYTGDNYGVSLTYGVLETSTTDEDTFTAFNAYYTPEGFPSISVGYEIGEAQGLPELTQWFVGLQWDEAGPGTLGTALGTVGASQNAVNPTVNDPELLMYEVFYSYALNDGMTITPLIYTKETVSGTEDKTGYMVKTSFSF